MFRRDVYFDENLKHAYSSTHSIDFHDGGHHDDNFSFVEQKDEEHHIVVDVETLAVENTPTMVKKHT